MGRSLLFFPFFLPEVQLIKNMINDLQKFGRDSLEREKNCSGLIQGWFQWFEVGFQLSKIIGLVLRKMVLFAHSVLLSLLRHKPTS